jgi:hypothetical protein
MTVQSMHYDFKQKLNRMDSQKYRDMVVPEIDWKLNEAQEVFVKIIAQPRVASQIGFESNQRTIDDIRVLVVEQVKGKGSNPVLYNDGDKSYISKLPTDYAYYVNGSLTAQKETCIDSLGLREVQHDDEAESSMFDISNFFWRIANIRFNGDGIRVYTGGGDFIPLELNIDYIRQPRLIYNAADWDAVNGYFLDGVQLKGTQDCELPSILHKEIVDLAVFIASGDLTLPSYAYKKYKTDMTDKK